MYFHPSRMRSEDARSARPEENEEFELTQMFNEVKGRKLP
jgi:hypothetical protein